MDIEVRSEYSVLKQLFVVEGLDRLHLTEIFQGVLNIFDGCVKFMNICRELYNPYSPSISILHNQR